MKTTNPISGEQISTIDCQFAPYIQTDDQSFETSLQTLNNSVNVSLDYSSRAHVQTSPSNKSERFLRGMLVIFSPVALAMLSISIFMRIGFVLAHAGVIQTLIQLGVCLIILVCTVLSICSLATNGRIDSGGVYHMISRSLGPEFGGGVGVLFYVATVIGNGQSVAALVEILVELFGPGSKHSLYNSKYESKFNLLII